ncbi:hypothetical protein ACI65C_001874 [Semiaphis heraclei]
MLEHKFRLVFVRDACAADREDEMRARKQGPTESLISYLQPKLRMCRGIGHSFKVSKDYVLWGLRSKDMALYAVGRVHTSEEELLSDLLNWERMCALHAPVTAPKYVVPQTVKVTPARPLPKKRTDESSRLKKVDKTTALSIGEPEREQSETEDQNLPDLSISVVPKTGERRSQRKVRRPDWMRDYSW